jgi:orotate phosphoribosyltransferase
VGDCLALPWAELVARPGGDPWARALDPGRFLAPRPLPGAAVLLVDDTWTTGSTAQSAAIALRSAGARSVAAVVLGRHLPPAAAMQHDRCLVVNRLGA